MAKNPIFPLYYNDILGSTKTWTDEEFGAYMRLLIEQWDNGFIPNPYQNVTNELQPDYQRLTRISTSVEKNWRLLSTKFTEADVGMQNQRLEEIRNLKLKHAERQRENVKKRYQTSTKQGTKLLPLEDEYEIEYIINQLREIGKIVIEIGQEKLFLMIVLKMMEVFKSQFPDYFFHKESDYSACLQIAYNIAEMKKWPKDSILNGNLTPCVESWDKIVQFIKEDDWMSSRSLTDLSTVKEWQRLVQKMTKPKKDELKKHVVGRDNPHDQV